MAIMKVLKKLKEEALSMPKKAIRRAKINADGLIGQTKSVLYQDNNIDWAGRPNKTGEMFSQRELGKPGSKLNGLSYDERVQMAEKADGKIRANNLKRIQEDRTKRVKRMSNY